MQNFEDKVKISVWLFPETYSQVRQLYKESDCRTKSEFIENAIRFYVGYLTAENPASFLPNLFLSNMKGIVDESDSKRNGLMFKMAVEIAMLQNIIAANYDIDSQSLELLRGQCVKEVKRINGTLSLKDAVDWQK